MRRMMRITTLLFVCSTIVGCSWGGDSGNGGGGGGPDAAVSQAVCGDSVCAASEVGHCTADCGSGGGSGSGSGSGSGTGAVCGNNTCETGETNANCPNDCTGGGGGTGTCPANILDCALCAIVGQSCPTGLDMTSCAACLSSGGGGGGDLLCTGGAPDGTCDAMESNATCPTDCP